MVFQILLQQCVRGLHFLGHRLRFLVHLHILGGVVGQVRVPVWMPCDQKFLVPLVQRRGVQRQGEVEEFESLGNGLFRMCRQ